MTEPERPTPPAESRFRRGVRHTHRTGLYVALAVAFATVVFLILLIVQNSRHVKVDYVFGTSHTRLIWLIIVTGFLGWLLGLATSYLVRRRTRRPR
jgi:uncharacterized integral membrane protein